MRNYDRYSRPDTDNGVYAGPIGPFAPVSGMAWTAPRLLVDMTGAIDRAARYQETSFIDPDQGTYHELGATAVFNTEEWYYQSGEIDLDALLK